MEERGDADAGVVGMVGGLGSAVLVDGENGGGRVGAGGCGVVLVVRTRGE